MGASDVLKIDVIHGDEDIDMVLLQWPAANPAICLDLGVADRVRPGRVPGAAPIEIEEPTPRQFAAGGQSRCLASLETGAKRLH